MNWDIARNRIWTERRVSAAGTPLRVLVVDDNRNAADALAMYLHLEALDIRTAYGGKQAVEVAKGWTPHLIVMDISMPGCTGFEAALVIRRDTKTSHIAIVAFTALDETEVRRHLMDHEFDAYCQKGQPPQRTRCFAKTADGRSHLTLLGKCFVKLKYVATRAATHIDLKPLTAHLSNAPSRRRATLLQLRALFSEQSRVATGAAQ